MESKLKNGCIIRSDHEYGFTDAFLREHLSADEYEDLCLSAGLNRGVGAGTRGDSIFVRPAKLG